MHRFLAIATFLVFLSCGPSVGSPVGKSPTAILDSFSLSVPELGGSADPVSPTPTDEARHALPYGCDKFEVVVMKDGRTRHRRLRKRWTAADQKRFSRLVRMVAREMGADPALIGLWSMRESSHNPNAIHVLNPDLESSRVSWRKYRWDPDRAEQLERAMASSSARDDAYWKAKAELSRIQTFRDNPYFDHVIDHRVVLPDGTKYTSSRSSWAYGYGAFGFNPTYFLPTWDPTMPPWVFCDAYGIPAIVTAIWSARKHQRECEAQGFGGSYLVVNRRYSSGHCRDRGSERAFERRARSAGIVPGDRAELGSRWPASSTDRQEIVRHMVDRARRENILEGEGEP